MIHSGSLKFPHIAIHSAYDLIVVFLVDLRILHIPAGKFLGQNLVEDIVFVECDGFMNAAVAISSGRNVDIVPLFHKDVHAVAPAQTEELALQIIIGGKPVITPG